MTYRAKPAVRSRRAAWDSPERRNLLLNIGFGLVVLLAVLLLIGAAALTWYNQHLAPVASVDGQSITRGDFTRRFDVEALRLDLAESRILDEFNAGRVSTDQRDQQLQFLDSQRQQLASVTLERLIDIRVESVLAGQEGISVSQADVDAQVTEEATTPEQRHGWVIAVEPDVADDAEEPTEQAMADAREKADDALADLRGGTPWEDVVVEVSTDVSAGTGGDLGWVTKESTLDDAFLEALFAVEVGEVTDVIEGEDGIFRIGRVTDVVAEYVEPEFRRLVQNRGVPTDVYLAAVQDDVVTEKLREKIEAQALAEGPQREVADIFLEHRAAPDPPPDGSVKTRHILFAPNDDPDAAAQVPGDDPAWAEAENAARAVYETLQEDITRFDSLARQESDEAAAETTGGKLPWFDPAQLQSNGGSLDDAFGAAIFKDGLEPGQLLEPFKSGFGWHVVQITYFPTDEEKATELKAELDAGADFAELAKEWSYGPEATEGGELGWIARFQLDATSEEAIFNTPVGSISDPVTVAGEGVHLYRVMSEETRTPEGEQKQTLENGAYTNWYAAKKEGFEITRDPSFIAPAG